MKQKEKIKFIINSFFAILFAIFIFPSVSFAGSGTAGSVCTAPSDCTTGLTCYTGKCTASCAIDSDCPGQVCDLNNYVCVNKASTTATGTGSCGSYDPSTIQLVVGVNPDGICGPETFNAIRQWQSSHNLTPDGIVGPQTAQAMGLQSTSGTSGSPTTNGSIKCPEPLVAKNGTCLPPDGTYPSTGFAGTSNLTDLLARVIKLLLTFAGTIAVVMLVLGGYWYMAAGGNEEMAEKGKNTIVNFVLGLVVIIMAYAIVTILFDTLTSTKIIGQ